MRKRWIVLILAVALATHLFVEISDSMTTRMNVEYIVMTDPDLTPTSVTVAVVGDAHIDESAASMEEFRRLLQEIRRQRPDIVLFVGDYVSGSADFEDFAGFRETLINAMKTLDPVPRAIVLGNHETWTGIEGWLADFKRLGVDVMENETRRLPTRVGDVCVRGLGDSYTDRFAYVDFPDDCDSRPKITITHDPAGAFDDRVSGLVIAAHTHCGQHSLPLVGPLWRFPTEAPVAAQCGVYRDDKVTLFVTSGIGTSLYPFRYRVQSEWDLISLRWLN